MSQFSSLFSQVLGLIDKNEFRKIVAETQAERHARGFASWEQLVSMMFCQLGRAHSLREVCDGLASVEGKLNHLGVESPKRSTLAYANSHRPSATYQQLFERTLMRLSGDLNHQGLAKHPFKFKHKLYSIDATTIDLCLSMYDWAKFRRTKGAIKIHLKLDHDGCLPSYAVFTEGNRHEVTVSRHWKFEPGAIIVFDRGYADYAWWAQLCRDGVFFVTRAKDNLAFDYINEDRMLMKWKVAADDTVRLTGASAVDCPDLRQIVVQDQKSGKYFTFLTNNFKLSATTIADIYQQRWQIELFFKALKSHLKIKTFLGTTRNAVWTQIWTALLTILLLKYLQLRSQFGWSFSNLLALLRFNIFTYRSLWEWLKKPFDCPPRPPDSPQLALTLHPA